MRVNPVSPTARAANDKRPAREYDQEPRARREEPATRPATLASVSLEVYGNPAPFGAFARYGNFSAIV